MKKTTYLFAIALLISNFGFSQTRSSAIAIDTDEGSPISVTNRSGNFLIPVTHMRLMDVDKSVLKVNVELEKKKYLNYNYDLASVDDYDTKAYIRYNIFDDEIEFVKEESIYYLVKEVGRKIVFANTKSIYKVYDLKGDLSFFQVHLEGKNSLIAKQRVRYIDAKIAKSGYDRAKPADYKRVKDELYLAKANNQLTKIPNKKKEFYFIFGAQSDTMKSYMKANKLNHKNISDLKKIIQHYNTL